MSEANIISPEISIIIPTYNSEKTIRETIESVLKQTFINWELIIINDGSTDSTLEIASNFTDSRIQVFSYPHGGGNCSRNRGFKHALGELISFLDADDLWTPDKLESQFNALQSNPEASVAYSWTNCIDENGHFLRRGSYITANGNVYAQLLIINFLEHGSNPLIKREAFNAVGGFDESLNAGQDWDLYLRLAAKYNFVAVPFPQILYRVSSNSLSSNVARLEAACLTVLDRAFNHTSESLQYLKKHSLANLYKYLIYKSLDGFPDRNKTLISCQLLWKLIINHPSFLLTTACLKVMLKIVVIVILPYQISQIWLTKFPRISNITTLLGHLKLNI